MTRLTFLIPLSVFSLALICVLSFFYRTSEPKIVSFDLKGTQALFIRQSSARLHDKALIEAKSKAFAQSIDLATKEYAKAHHATVLIKGAAIAGVKDVTPQIQALIAEHMKALDVRPQGSKTSLSLLGGSGA